MHTFYFGFGRMLCELTLQFHIVYSDADFFFYISLSLAICSWLVCVLGRLERSFPPEGYPALSAILCKYTQGVWPNISPLRLRR